MMRSFEPQLVPQFTNRPVPQPRFTPQSREGSGPNVIGNSEDQEDQDDEDDELVPEHRSE